MAFLDLIYAIPPARSDESKEELFMIFIEKRKKELVQLDSESKKLTFMQAVFGK